MGGRHQKLAAELVAKGGAVHKTAGIGNLRYPQAGGGQHLLCHRKAVPNQILLRRGSHFLAEQLIKISAVNPHIAGHIPDFNIVSIIILYIFYCFLQVSC